MLVSNLSDIRDFLQAKEPLINSRGSLTVPRCGMFLDGVYDPPVREPEARASTRWVTSTWEMSAPSVADAHLAHLDTPRSISVRRATADRSCRNSVPVRFRIKPELRLTVRTEDVDVAPRLLTREEVEPRLPLHPDRAAKRRSLESLCAGSGCDAGQDRAGPAAIPSGASPSPRSRPLPSPSWPRPRGVTSTTSSRRWAHALDPAPSPSVGQARRAPGDRGYCPHGPHQDRCGNRERRRTAVFSGMKHSRVGREGGFEALRFFTTEAKNVCIERVWACPALGAPAIRRRGPGIPAGRRVQRPLYRNTCAPIT